MFRKFLEARSKILSSDGDINGINALDRCGFSHCLKKKANLLNRVNVGSDESACQYFICVLIPGEWGNESAQAATSSGGRGGLAEVFFVLIDNCCEQLCRNLTEADISLLG